jgi:methyl-accepting chemotaxis protein
MVPSIQKTSELVQEITAASSEQSESVSQIKGAMGHLSRATQQNASASEELAATAEELSGQAAQLQESVGFFRVGDEAPMLAAPAPAAELGYGSRRTSPATMTQLPRASVSGNENFKPF